MPASEELLLRQEQSRIKVLLAREEGKTLKEHEGNREFNLAIEAAFLEHLPLARSARSYLQDFSGEEKNEILLTAFRKAIHGYDGCGPFSNYFYSLIRGNADLARNKKNKKTVSLDADFNGQRKGLHDVIPSYDDSSHLPVLDSARKLWNRIVSHDKLRDIHAQVILRSALFGEPQLRQGVLLGAEKPLTRQRISEFKRFAMRNFGKGELKIAPGKFDRNRFYVNLFSELPFAKENESLFTEILREHGEDAAYLAARFSPVFKGSKSNLPTASSDLFLSKKAAALTFNRLLEKYPELGKPFQINPRYAEASRKQRFTDAEVKEKILKFHEGSPLFINALPHSLRSILSNRPELTESLRKRGVLMPLNSGIVLPREEAASRLNEIRSLFREKGRPLFYGDFEDKRLHCFVSGAIKRGSHQNLTKGELREMQSMQSKVSNRFNVASPVDKTALRARMKEIRAHLAEIKS